MASDKVAMPMSHAGIVGFSPDVKTSGMEMDPKIIIGAIIALVIVVHIAGFVATA